MNGIDQSSIVLEARGLTKRFSGFTAVNNVNLRVKSGSIHALIGPNGAGKSTLFNLLTKFLAPSEGQIFYKGEDITGLEASQIARKGLVRSFQISSVFPGLSVRDNVRIALQERTGLSFKFWKPERVLNHLHGRVEELLALVDLTWAAHLPAAELSYGRKRALELAMSPWPGWVRKTLSASPSSSNRYRRTAPCSWWSITWVWLKPCRITSRC